MFMVFFLGCNTNIIRESQFSYFININIINIKDNYDNLYIIYERNIFMKQHIVDEGITCEERKNKKSKREACSHCSR